MTKLKIITSIPSSIQPRKVAISVEDSRGVNERSQFGELRSEVVIESFTEYMRPEGLRCPLTPFAPGTAAGASAQNITLPHPGGNQRNTTTVTIGLVKVDGPRGRDRRGHIRGEPGLPCVA